MKSKKGFLLIEAIFSVFITLLIVIALQNLLVSLKTARHLKHPVNEVAFSYIQLNNFLKEHESYVLPELSNSRKADFSGLKDNNKVYVLEKYKNMIRVTTNASGHMPLLLNVDQAEFETSKNRIKIFITEEDGRKSELYFKLREKPDEAKEEKKAVKGKRTSE